MSKIEWTQLTWNPTTGCDKVSRGCKFCYAEVMHKRLRGMGQPKYQHKFLGNVKTHPEELKYPSTVKKPSIFFVDSMSDLFHKDVPFEFIREVYCAMGVNQHHTFQVLTKRPDRALEFYRWFANYVNAWDMGSINQWHREGMKNIWIGTSVENQEAADLRIPYLMNIQAAVRFLSCEPLLGQVDLSTWFGLYQYEEGNTWHTTHSSRFKDSPDWVIVGGESGNKKGIDPMHPNWARLLRDQCRAAKVPFFFKQWGEWHESDFSEVKFPESKKHLFPGGKLMYRLGKKRTGNFLDGMQHLEMPK